jgi:hypothetical protein
MESLLIKLAELSAISTALVLILQWYFKIKAREDQELRRLVLLNLRSLTMLEVSIYALFSVDTVEERIRIVQQLKDDWKEVLEDARRDSRSS